jgi:hypothetical protein
MALAGAHRQVMVVEDGHNDPIQSLFAVLRVSMCDDRNVNSAKEETNVLSQSLAAEERVIRRICQTQSGRQFSSALRGTVDKDWESALGSIRGSYLARKKHREQHIEDLRAQQDRFASTIDFHVSSVKFREALFHRQMRQSASSSLRRLQELLFEVLGEITKASMRCKQYVQRLQSVFDEDVQKSKENLLWKRFIDRAQEDSLQQMHIHDLGPHMNGSMHYANTTHDSNASDLPSYDSEMMQMLTNFAQRLIAEQEEVPVEDVHVSRLLEVRYKSSTLSYNHSDVKLNGDSHSNNGPGRRRGRAHPVFDTPLNTLAGKCTAVRDLSILMAQIVVGAGHRRGREPLQSRSDKYSGSNAEDVQDQSSPKHGSTTRLFRRSVPSTVQELPMFSPQLFLSGKILWWILSFAPQAAGGGGEQNPSIGVSESSPKTSFVPLDTRIYYCVEEAEQSAIDCGNAGNCWSSAPSPHADDATFWASAIERAAEKIYSSNPDTANLSLGPMLMARRTDAKGRSLPLPISVSALCGLHRENVPCVQRLQDEFKTQGLTMDLARRLQAFPDVLECRTHSDSSIPNTTLHFAPASLLQLLQTPEGRTMMSSIRSQANASELDKTYNPNLIKFGKVPNLYVVVPPEQVQPHDNLSPLVHGQIQPLSIEAVQEMLAVYVCRHPNQALNPSHDCGGLPSAMHVFPDGNTAKNNASGKRLLSSYTAIQNPSLYNQSSFAQRLEESQKLESKVVEPTGPPPHFASTYDESWDEYNNQIRNDGFSHDINASTSQNITKRKSDIDPRVAYLFVQYEIANKIDDFKGPASRQQQTLSRPNSQKILGSAAFSSLLLPHMCWWRACLSPACEVRGQDLVGEKSNSKKGQLVERTCWHCSNLKDFLDAQSKPNVQSEAQRYLPKYSQKKEKSLQHLPPQLKDLQLIKVSSTLLQELCTKKLATTISSFCKKATSDARVHGKNLSTKAKASTGVESTVQKTLEFCKGTLQQCQQAVEHAKQLREIEAKVTSDLRRLIEMKAFPSAELAIIRKEQKALEQEKGLHASSNNMEGSQVVPWPENSRNQNGNGSRKNLQNPDREATEAAHLTTKKQLFDLELQFCMRKSLLLRQRVQEVEASMAMRGGVQRGSSREQYRSK